jgi:hypothetical protein
MEQYINIPWKAGGRTREGLDCAGLTQLWLQEQMGLPELTLPASPTDEQPDCRKYLGDAVFRPGDAMERGDVVFFRARDTKKVCHVAVHLGGGKLLNIVNGHGSRVENGFTLLRRVGLEPFGVISARETARLCAALQDPALGTWAQVIQLVVVVALSAASYALKPKIGRNPNGYGRYGFDALITKTDPQIPMPDQLGCMVLAGNSVYQQLLDKRLVVDLGATATAQKINKIVVLCSGPTVAFTCDDELIKINGLNYGHVWFKSTGTADAGFKLNPAQTKAEAVDGTISAVGDRPSITTYLGTHGITVPVDIRASYDRNFPIYGLPGCTYLVFRLVDSTKYSDFNALVPLAGRYFRTFDANGFITGTSTNESLAGADGSKVRFKTTYADIQSVASVTVNGTPYTEMSASNQSGSVFNVNKTKGFIEFLAAPAAAAVVLITYTVYTQTTSVERNPAMHLVFLLTDKWHGKGYEESKINWAAAQDFYDYCAASVTWRGVNGPVTQARYQCDYAIDFRRPIQEHIKAILDSAYAYLFVSNGKFVMKARQAGASVFSFTTSNIKLSSNGIGEAVSSTFWAEQVERAEVSNRIHGFFHSKNTLNNESEIVREDQVDQRAKADNIGNDGVVEETVKFPAVTIPEQAERLTEQILREDLGRDWVCGFSTSVKGLALEPADIIDVTHPSQPGWAAKKFVVEVIEHDDDDDLVLKCTEYVESAYI